MTDPAPVAPDPWIVQVGIVLGIENPGSDGPRAVVNVDAKRWHEAVRACRDDLGCDFFDWLSAVDEGPVEEVPIADDSAVEGNASEGPQGETTGGFRIVAHLWSVAERRGVLLKARLTEGAVASVTDLYPGANWHERETHEMFGVDFPGHPELAPLLLPPEFEGHPLRKDFVLASRVVKAWPGAKEPGGDRPSKRAPKRPPGVPEDWIQPPAEPGADPRLRRPDAS